MTDHDAPTNVRRTPPRFSIRWVSAGQFVLADGSLGSREQAEAEYRRLHPLPTDDGGDDNG